MRVINVSVELTRKGLPAIWEAGGGKTRTGWAQIIAGADGAPKRPLSVRRSGHLALGNHALIPVSCGDYIVWARRGGQQPEVEVAVIGNIDESTATAFAAVIVERINGVWTQPLPSRLEAAVEAAERKAACYHCRGPHFILNE